MSDSFDEIDQELDEFIRLRAMSVLQPDVIDRMPPDELRTLVKMMLPLIHGLLNGEAMHDE